MVGQACNAIFLFSIVPYLPESLNVKGQILGLLKDLTPNSTTYTFIQNLIAELFKKHIGVFSFGFILLMFYASNAMIGVIRAFDKSILEKKNFFLHQRWRAIRLTAILILLILASALVLIGQQELAGILRDIFHYTKKTSLPWWNAVRWTIIFSVLFFWHCIHLQICAFGKKTLGYFFARFYFSNRFNFTFYLGFFVLGKSFCQL